MYIYNLYIAEKTGHYRVLLFYFILLKSTANAKTSNLSALLKECQMHAITHFEIVIPLVHEKTNL